MNVLDDISKVGRDLMWKQEYYGIFLSQLNKVINNSIPTAGVSKNGINVQLSVNKEFWEKELNQNTRLGVLWHELLHIVLSHLSLRDSYSDKHMFNVAADLAINQLIPAQYRDDEKWLELTRFNKKYNLNMNALQSTKYYYDEIMKSGKQDQISGDYGAPQMHITWGEFDDLSPTEKQMIEKQIQYQVKQAAEAVKTRGTIPGEVQSILDELDNVKPPAFNWKAYLRRFAGGSNEYYIKKTRRRPSVRFPEAAGNKVKQKNHILVAIDTSGSVSDDELKEFMGEIHHIYKAGTKITIAQCDAHINSIEEYKGMKGSIKISGRGGTEFTPICDHFNKFKDKYSSCVYFTDGEGHTSTKPFKPMLWVHSSRSHVNESLPGFKIKIP